MEQTPTDPAQSIRGRTFAVRNPKRQLLLITGSDSLAWLQGQVSNDVRRLERGEASIQACVLNATGHLLADVMLFSLPPASPVLSALGMQQGAIVADLPAMQISKVRENWERFIVMENVILRDAGEMMRRISIHGPGAGEALPEALAALCTIYPSNSAAEGGSELLFPVSAQPNIEELLLAAGIVFASAEAAELIRIEEGRPEFGPDMDESVIALEARLGPTHISLSKGCYVGQEIIARIDARGHTNRGLVGLVLEPDAVINAGERIFAGGEEATRETGRVTSAAGFSPTVGAPIALGYVRHEHGEPGSTVWIVRDGSRSPAQIVSLPFTSLASG